MTHRTDLFAVGGHLLGPLEAQLLRAVRKRGNATVRELLESSSIECAYTTVMTTLDRLYKKGLLDRSQDGRAFRYDSRETDEEMFRLSFANNLQTLLNSATDTATPLSFLVDTLTDHDAALLDELEKAVNRKRRELLKKDSK